MINQLKTLLLFGLLTIGLAAVGAMLGPTAFLASLVLAVAVNVGGYFFSDRLVLRMHGAREMERSEFPELHVMTEELAARAGIPAPRLYLIPALYPNAFAAGRSPRRGVVAVTEGLCQLLNDREMRAVIAHEIAHIRNRDVLIATLAAIIAAAVAYVANLLHVAVLFGGGEDEESPSPLAALAVAIVAPVGAVLLQMGISRSREYLADAEAARFSGDPQALAAALDKLTRASPLIAEEPSPAAASLFVVNPLRGGRANWFSTHPPAEERIARLTRLALRGAARRGAAVPPLPAADGARAWPRSRWPQSA